MELEGGLVIDLPLTDIKENLNKLIEVDNFESDQVLLEFLRGLYNQAKAPKTNIESSLTREQLNSLPTFQDQSPELLDRIFDSMDAIMTKRKKELDASLLEMIERPVVKRREMKRIEKERRVRALYFKEQVKPRYISKEVNLPRQVVNSILAKCKYQLGTLER